MLCSFKEVNLKPQAVFFLLGRCPEAPLFLFTIFTIYGTGCAFFGGEEWLLTFRVLLTIYYVYYYYFVVIYFLCCYLVTVDLITLCGARYFS